MTLEELRKQWEKGFEVKYEKGDNFEFLVILAKRSNKYHCHRYFTIGSDWQVSVDGRDVTIDQVWSWLKTPQVISN